MIFVSVADACRRLGVDAKTLHRWLSGCPAFPANSHPCDGRKKGVSQRAPAGCWPTCIIASLAPLPEEPVLLPAFLPDAPLACRPAQRSQSSLCAMQAHLVTLQQQVADLTRLLTQHGPEPAIPAGSHSSQTRTLKRRAKPTPPAPRSRPAAKPPSQACPCHPSRRVWTRRDATS